jgi:asparagine synthase (glutamine-hydrolysing)
MAGEHLVFASELKALHKHPHFKPSINTEALSLYFKYCYVPHPLSIYQEVKKLTPGTFVSGKTPNEIFSATPKTYWSAQGAANLPRREWTDEEAIQAVESQLQESISSEMISDVPLGAFLSGGVDSSLICALAQKSASQSLRTFTIGYKEKEFDESENAQLVARHLGCKHTEWIITQADTRNIIPELPQIYDEPFADASQLPTTMLSRLTRQQVTVALSGDGADEVFGGYNRYLWTESLTNQADKLPRLFRQLLAGGIQSLSPEKWNYIHSALGKNSLLSTTDLGTKLYKVAEVLKSESKIEAYDRLLSTWTDTTKLMPSAKVSPSLLSLNQNNFTEQMMLLDAQNYLTNDIMVKVDRASMSASLESRAPFLDHKVFELAWSLPLNMKIRNGTSKWVLRQILNKHLPKELIERPKMGFAMPLRQWLRHELKDWAHDLLTEDRIKKQGLLDPSCVQKTLSEHMSGKRDHAYKLWTLLAYQSWSDQWTP